MKTIYFKDIKPGQVFYCNGNKCFKRSSKTATLLEFNKWYYFEQNAICTLEEIK
jgi:hypothetical protein